MTSTSSSSPKTGLSATPPREEDLRKQLKLVAQSLQAREPLDPSYKRLLMNGFVTARRPVLPKDKFYKKIGSNIRGRMEAFMIQTQGKDPFDRIGQRQPLEESAMRAAFTLREAKDHEQQALLDATMSSFPRRNGMDELTRRKHLEGIASFLLSRDPVAAARSKSPPPTAAEQTEHARQQADLDRQREQTKVREDARRKREEDDRRRQNQQHQQQSQPQQQQQRREDEKKRKRTETTTEQSLSKLYQPIFRKLWDMEFPHLGGTNPFRIVIDRENCASVGAPDYFDVIEKPMNLTYIQQKVDNLEYASLKAFFDDVDLMIRNAILYNSDPSNPYRVAAEEMKKKFNKIARKVVQTVQQRRSNNEPIA